MNWKKNLRGNKSGLSSFGLCFFAWLLAILVFPGGCAVDDDFSDWSGSMEAGYDFALDVTADASGNAFITGHTSGSLDESLNQGGMDLILAKYDSSSDRKWVKHLGSEHNDRGAGVVVNQSGDIFVVGWTNGAPEGGSGNGYSDILLIKYSSNGARQWLRRLGSESSDQGTAITIDASSGDILITGYSYGALDGETHFGGGDAFIMRFDADGNRKWTKQIGSDENELSLDVAIDESGDICIVGYTYGDLDGTGDNTLRGGSDIFVAKYDSTGDPQWLRQFGTESKDFGLSLAVDSSNNIFVAGYTYGDLDGTADNTHRGGSDIFAAKHDSTGDRKWLKQQGTAYNDEAKGIAIDASGDIIIAGQTMGGMEGSNQGGRDIFLMKIKDMAEVTDDAIKWTRQIGSAADDFTAAIAIDSSNDIFVTGQTHGDLNGVVNKGHSDIFLFKRDASGDPK